MSERFIIKETQISGVTHIFRTQGGDERGWFERFFCLDTMQEKAEWPGGIVHVNRTYTKHKGTVRGMHYQHPPHAEYKYVSCLSGKIFDVVLDLRENSPTFMQHYGAILSSENNESLIVPAGCAHGFQSLTENSFILYLVSKAYSFEHEGVVNPMDPRHGIDWPEKPVNLSSKDQSAPFLTSDFKGIKL